MNNEIKEILFSLLNVFVIGIIFAGLSDPVDGLIVAVIIIAIVFGIAYSPIGDSATKLYLHKMKIKTSEETLRFPYRFWILSFAAYTFVSWIIGIVMAVVMFIGKFLIAFCIWLASGKWLNGDLVALFGAKQLANLIVDVYDFCTSLTDKVIKFVMNLEAKAIGIKQEI